MLEIGWIERMMQMNKDVLDYVCDKDAKEIIKKEMNKLNELEELIVNKINNMNSELLRITSMHYETSFMRDKKMHLRGEIDALNMVLVNIENMKEGENNA